MHGTDPGPSRPTDGTSTRQRQAPPRRALPTGRALVGGLLVTLAAVVVFAAWAGAQERPATTVVVVRHDVDPGVRLTADDLEARTVELSPELAGATFTAVDALVGATTLGPLGAGEVVQRGSVRPSSTFSSSRQTHDRQPDLTRHDPASSPLST